MVETAYYRFDDLESEFTIAPAGRHTLFSDNEFVSRLRGNLDKLLDGQRILSLDVFDTLLLRDNSSELTRFFEVGGRMAQIVEAETGQAVSQVDALVARHLGTKATYRASQLEHGCREGSLTELHTTASRLLANTNKLTELFISAELENETQRIKRNEFLFDFVADYRSAGGRVVLISDMYMHKQHIAKLLEDFALGPDGYDFLVSSADTKVSKASGRIFSLVEQDLGEAADNFVHVGDSLRGDFVQPLRMGWSAVHWPLAKFDILERQRDHLVTQELLASKYGLELDIAMPR
tara:strand:+ start:1132 stop:2010 length:879 start_codon:yes stop_codon:yes gene_type:complete